MNIKRSFSVVEVSEILGMRKSGYTAGQIAKKFNRTTSSIHALISNYNLYQKGLDIQSRTLVKIFEQLSPTEGIVERPERELEVAYQKYNEAVANFINTEVEKRVAHTLEEKQLEINTLKDKYEKELQRLQSIIVEMKDSSVVGLIKKKWSNGGI